MSGPESEDAVPVRPRIRLQRYLAACGLGSRRECEEYISSGRVSIGGEVVSELGVTVDPQTDHVELDGERLHMERKRYYMLNKPPGYLCTASDPAGRPRAIDLLPGDGPRLFTVGRLDEATTGLLIVTNDGDLAQKLAHPRHRIYRLYKAQVAGHPGPDVFEQLKEGMYFTEGKFRVHDVRPVKKQGKSTWLEVTMREGQNREVRRLFARLGHKVMKLERIGFGPLRLGRLPLGQFRELRREELAKLHEVLTRNRDESTGVDSRRGGANPPRQRTRATKRPAESGPKPSAKKTQRVTRQAAGNSRGAGRNPGAAGERRPKGVSKKRRGR